MKNFILIFTLIVFLNFCFPGTERLKPINEIDNKKITINHKSKFYPLYAVENGVEGGVTAVFFLDETGRIINYKILESTDSIFIKSSIDYLYNFKFEKPLQRIMDKPYITKIKVYFIYKL